MPPMRETSDALQKYGSHGVHRRRRDGSAVLQRRDGATSSKVAIIVVVTLIIVVSVTILSYIILRSIRKRHSSPRFIPMQALKRRWEAWNPYGGKGKNGYSAQAQQRSSSVPTLLGRDGRRSNRNSRLDLPDVELARSGGENGQGESGDVARHESVRSIMTLPAYSKSVRENERILGREGDRDGIDVVVEAPETEEMEEERREEEMESLYQIRVQRRRENAEREERRRERREARDRGDFATLNRLRQESRLRAEERSIHVGVSDASAMIAEHQSRSRERRVSSVSYGDLGVARHDGSRVRANSQESHRALLSDAASIGGASLARPWTGEGGGRNSLSVHHRDYSGSALSISDAEDGSEFGEAPPFGRAGSDFEVVSFHQAQSHSRGASRQLTPVGTRSRASSASTGGLAQIDTSAVIDDESGGREPPRYSATGEGGGFEEAPPYTSPIRERAPPPRPQHERAFSASGAPLLPGIERLPSIRIADPTPGQTPVDNVAGEERWDGR